MHFSITRPLSGLLVLVLIFSCKQEKQDPPVITVNKENFSKYACVPQVTDAEWYKADNVAPLLEGYEVIDYPIKTTDPLVQRYFNQGLALAYGFNHAEAARSFYYATKLDPECAMAYWGFAYVLGPNYNAGMEDDNYERAYEAIQKAIELSAHSPEKEKELIRVMALRYSEVPPEDRSPLDIAYSEALKKLSETYPDDSEIGTLYAESVMNLHPWDLYDKTGSPKPWTPAIVDVLETTLEKFPDHPGAHHLYIHAVEASSSPERSLESARLFDDGLVPGSGHLLHMPSHTYIRTGDYHKGTLSNIAAVKADSTYVTACHAQGAYPLAYYPHNYHFMAATATLEGNSHWAMVGANKVSEHVHPEIMKDPYWGTLQHFYTIPYYVLVKFEKWDEILERQMPTYDLNYIKAVRYYAEGMAHLGKEELEQARKALSELVKLSEDESIADITVWEINSMYDLVIIARNVLKAEIMARSGELDGAIKLLEDTVVLEDKLNYNEPPDWFFSVRHNLGRAQLKAGLYEEAVATFSEDLINLPRNGWAYMGLMQAYEKLDASDEYAMAKANFEQSWAHADFEL